MSITLYNRALRITVAILGTGLTASALATAESPRIGGNLIYLDQQAHTNLYPAIGGFYPNGGILNQITDKLTWQNPTTLKIEPWLAESWGVNNEKTEYTFKIRPNVTFSDGTPVDAYIVAKNFDYYGLGDKSHHYPASEVINNYLKSEVIDPLTVKFYFKKPSPGFLQGTSAIGSGIVSLSTLEHDFNQLGNGRNVVGSGPFIIQSDRPGHETLLTARKDYNWAPASFKHQGRPYLDSITVLVMPEDGVRIGALLAKQADFIRQVQAYDEKRVDKQGFLIYAPPTRGVNNSISFRPDNMLVADIRVRKALLHATDTHDIVQTLYSNHYPQASSVLAKTAAGYVDLSSQLAFDPTTARHLLDEAGWRLGPQGIRQKEGQALTLTTYESVPHPQNKEMLQRLAQQWARIGVQLHIKSGDAGSRTVDLLDPEKTAIYSTMVGRADPDVLKSQYHPTLRNVLLQKGGLSTKVKQFEDTHLNTLLDAIASETNDQKRLALAGDVQRYLIQQAYVIPIFEEPQVYAGAPTTHGITFEAVGRPSFYNTWLDK